MLVDAAAMHLIRRPRDFDVLVTENMFGDILTDEASMLAGSLGCCLRRRLGDGQARAVRTDPRLRARHRRQGIANPFGTILSVALLLRHSLDLHEEAAALEAAVHRAIAKAARTADISCAGRASLLRPARSATPSSPRSRMGRAEKRFWRACGTATRISVHPARQPTADRALSGASDRRALQARRQVRLQILERFDADRQPQQSIRQPGRLPRHRIHRRMRHRRRMRDEALDAAQRLGQREALQPIDERAHRIVAALQFAASRSRRSRVC